MVSLCCRVPSKLLSLAIAAFVILSSISDDIVVVSAVEGEACTPGIELPDDFDDSATDWPQIYRLSSPDPSDPMASNAKYTYDVTVNPSVLAKAGITYKYMDPTEYDYPNGTSAIPWFPSPNGINDMELQDIRDNKDYQYADIIAVPAFFPSFWDEHFHEASTIRYILEGSGYFDLRDLNDEWVRMYATAGDFFEWPAGLNHRFTVDSEGGSFIQAMRLYKGSASPDWSAIPRIEAIPGNNTARDEYVSTYLCGMNPDDDELSDDDTINNIATPDEDDSDSDTDTDTDTAITTQDNVDSGAAGYSTIIGSLLSSLFIVVIGTM